MITHSLINFLSSKSKSSSISSSYSSSIISDKYSFNGRIEDLRLPSLRVHP